MFGLGRPAVSLILIKETNISKQNPEKNLEENIPADINNTMDETYRQ